MESNIKINRGLKGIYFERSSISDIDGLKGELTYRGYQIDDLAKNSTFEEVCYLIIFGDLILNVVVVCTPTFQGVTPST